MLAGLSKWEIFRIPPAFWGNAGSSADHPSSSVAAIASARMLRFISIASCSSKRIREIRHRRVAARCWAACTRQRSGGYHLPERRNSSGHWPEAGQILCAAAEKIRFYLDHIERFYGASQRLKGGVTRSLWRWSDASQGKATRFDPAERPRLLSSARDCRGPSTS